MAWQLVYTSAPRLLDAGRAGFGSVARHREIPPLLVQAIERFSQFARLPGLDPGRVIYCHRIIPLSGTRYHVLSMIRNAGADYTGRTNHIAHHLIATDREVTACEAVGVTPADVLVNYPWLTSWDRPPLSFDTSDEVPLADIPPFQLQTSVWNDLTGNAHNVCLLVTDPASRGCLLVGPAGTDFRLVFLESLRWHTGASWQVTLTTSAESSDEPSDFRWSACVDGSAASSSAGASGRPVLDLTRPESLPQPELPRQSIPETSRKSYNVPLPSLARPARDMREPTQRPSFKAQSSHQNPPHPPARTADIVGTARLEQKPYSSPPVNTKAASQNRRFTPYLVVGLFLSVLLLTSQLWLPPLLKTHETSHEKVKAVGTLPESTGNNGIPKGEASVQNKKDSFDVHAQAEPRQKASEAPDSRPSKAMQLDVSNGKKTTGTPNVQPPSNAIDFPHAAPSSPASKAVEATPSEKDRSKDKVSSTLPTDLYVGANIKDLKLSLGKGDRNPFKIEFRRKGRTDFETLKPGVAGFICELQGATDPGILKIKRDEKTSEKTLIANDKSVLATATKGNYLVSILESIREIRVIDEDTSDWIAGAIIAVPGETPQSLLTTPQPIRLRLTKSGLLQGELFMKLNGGYAPYSIEMPEDLLADFSKVCPKPYTYIDVKSDGLLNRNRIHKYLNTLLNDSLSPALTKAQNAYDNKKKSIAEKHAQQQSKGGESKGAKQAGGSSLPPPSAAGDNAELASFKTTLDNEQSRNDTCASMLRRVILGGPETSEEKFNSVFYVSIRINEVLTKVPLCNVEISQEE